MAKDLMTNLQRGEWTSLLHFQLEDEVSKVDRSLISMATRKSAISIVRFHDKIEQSLIDSMSPECVSGTSMSQAEFAYSTCSKKCLSRSIDKSSLVVLYSRITRQHGQVFPASVYSVQIVQFLNGIGQLSEARERCCAVK